MEIKANLSLGLVEVEAELGNILYTYDFDICSKFHCFCLECRMLTRLRQYLSKRLKVLCNLRREQKERKENK